MWTMEEYIWLKKNYPTLYKRDNNTIEGTIPFQMLRYDGRYILNPPSDLIDTGSGNIYLSDIYNIRIEWNTDNGMPTVYETKGRITTVAKRFHRTNTDLHLYPDGSFCLASPVEILHTFKNGWKLNILIEEYIIPFLFAQTYYSQNKIWPWGELSHGYIGLIEWLGRKIQPTPLDIYSTYKHLFMCGDDESLIIQLLSERLRHFNPCPCTSGKKVRKCHPDLIKGVSVLRYGLQQNIIT